MEIHPVVSLLGTTLFINTGNTLYFSESCVIVVEMIFSEVCLINWRVSVSLRGFGISEQRLKGARDSCCFQRPLRRGQVRRVPGNGQPASHTVNTATGERTTVTDGTAELRLPGGAAGGGGGGYVR